MDEESAVETMSGVRCPRAMRSNGERIKTQRFVKEGTEAAAVAKVAAGIQPLSGAAQSHLLCRSDSLLYWKPVKVRYISSFI